MNIIPKIIKATSLTDLIDVNHIDREFKRLSKLIHPDICPDPRAHTAMSKLNVLKREFEQGTPFEDDAGNFFVHEDSIRFEGTLDLLDLSFDNYVRLMELRDEASRHFQQYLPKSMYWEGNSLIVDLANRAVPISSLNLPQKHVNWILSRILEFTSWLSQVRYVHAGINPESVFIVPETHGIIITSFYHLTRLDAPISTISGRYQNWYTPSLFTEKKAISLIDLELAKKTAIYLLGDHSGSGIKLKKTHNPDFMDFVITQDKHAYQCFQKYRKMLAKNFPDKYYPLDI